MTYINESANFTSDLLFLLFAVMTWGSIDFVLGIISKKYYRHFLSQQQKKDKDDQPPIIATVVPKSTQKQDPNQDLKQRSDTEEPVQEEQHKQSPVDEVQSSESGESNGKSTSTTSTTPTITTTNPTLTKPTTPTTKDSGKPSIDLQCRKFHRSIYKAVNYSSLLIFGCVAATSQEWGWDRTKYYDDMPHPVSSIVRAYYLTQIAHYIYATLIIKTEPKQTDFWQMVFHHIVTLILLIFSYTLSYERIGVMFMIITDASDPILEMAKLTLYLKLQQVADHFFTLFAVVFLVNRLFVFPYMILIPGMNHPDLPYGDGLAYLLIVLQIVFVYWSWVILKVALDMTTGKVVVDSREQE